VVGDAQVMVVVDGQQKLAINNAMMVVEDVEDG